MLPEELGPAASLGRQLELITVLVVVPARTSAVLCLVWHSRRLGLHVCSICSSPRTVVDYFVPPCRYHNTRTFDTNGRVLREIRFLRLHFI